MKKTNNDIKKKKKKKTKQNQAEVLYTNSIPQTILLSYTHTHVNEHVSTLRLSNF